VSNGNSPLAALLGIVLFAACGQSSPGQQKTSDGAAAGSPQAAIIRVTGHGVDEGNASICEDFRLTEAQAQEFFAKAEAVTAEQIHDDYDVLPCWAQGTTESGAGKTTWKIRAGGTAEITDSKGDVTYLGCKTCDELFQ
jgi:hypothetical protein